MIRLWRAWQLVLVYTSTLAASVVAAAEALPPAAVVLDSDVLLYSWPYPTISPDGKLVAYISKGYVCVADVDNATTRQLTEVPGTWTHVLTLPKYAATTDKPHALQRPLESEERGALLKQVTNTAFGLQWTANSDGLDYGVLSYNAETKIQRATIWHVTLDGNVTQLAKIEQEIGARSRIADQFYITRDRRFLVAVAASPRPLIWDLASNKPRSTPFLHLTPSPTSDRWIGVEKDSRQLVILDQDFTVVQRFDEFLPARSFGFKLQWSPDERYVIWRNQVGFDHYSNWEGFRYDLQTHHRRILTGDHMSETCLFTGRRGEFLRVGIAGVQGMWSGLIDTTAYFQVVPDGDGFPERLWQLRADPRNTDQKSVRLGGQPPVVCSPDFNLFAIGLPRQGDGPPGIVYHLLDRERYLWRLDVEDNGKYYSPFQVVGFAKGGQTIVAHDDRRIFAVPVAAIQSAANKVR